MVNIRQAQNFCSEPIELIENYQEAVNDTTQVWHCHHRDEITYNLSRDELKNMKLYYKLPAEKLIFLTRFEHISLHSKNLREETKKKKSISMKGRSIIWLSGKKRSEESRKKQSETMKKMWEDETFIKKHIGRKQSEEEKNKRSESLKGKNINGKLSKIVQQYTLEGVFIAEYPSTMEIQRQLGFDSGSISKCCLGKRKSYKNFIWKYKE